MVRATNSYWIEQLFSVLLAMLPSSGALSVVVNAPTQAGQADPASSSPKSAAVDALLEAAFQSGEMKDHVYSNEVLGFSIEVPKDWKLIPKADIRRVTPQATKRNVQAHPERGDQIRANSRFTTILFMAAEKNAYQNNYL